MTFRNESPPTPSETVGNVSVEYSSGISEANDAQTTPAQSTPASGLTTEEELDGLTADELKGIVIKLRADLYRTKAELGNYEKLISSLPDKRDLLVSALSVVDALIATSNTQKREKRELACTAVGARIDKEWEEKVLTNEACRDWWTSKAKPIRSVKKDIPNKSPDIIIHEEPLETGRLGQTTGCSRTSPASQGPQRQEERLVINPDNRTQNIP